ncbi:O-antigen ligase family protein [Allomuricauda sp. CP2A]|jgi:hypothetical protein|uniref:O-antigen ligase family protein n=1 Tax=Allomuricauda sp. CP2A TaxID=1848189 RepID=UPI00082D7827|nr:O-antigen ligase family protein [Muricauda sp. CP2A]
MFKQLNIQNLLLFLGCGVMASLFLKENFNSLFIVAFSIVMAFYILFKDRKKNIKRGLLFCTPLLIYFFLAVFGLIINPSSNSNYVLRLLPFCLSPLFLYYFHSFKGNQGYTLKTFVFANILFLLFLDMLAINDMMASRSLYVESEGRLYYRFLYTRYTLGYFNHIYLGIYSLLSIVLLQQYKLIKSNGLRLVFVSYLLLHIVLLGSRAVIIAVLLAALSFLVFTSFRNRKFIKYLVAFLTVLSLSTSIVYFYRDTLVFNRYSQVFEWYENRDLLLKRSYSVNNRIKIYIVGYSMFTDSWRYGITGSGLASTEIQHKYSTTFKDDFNLKTITYNAHNQYINNFIDWGVLGVLLTVFIVILIIKTTYFLNLNWVAFFWTFFALVLLMESVLIRHRGIVLFVLFFSFFFAQKKSYSNEK